MWLQWEIRCCELSRAFQSPDGLSRDQRDSMSIPGSLTKGEDPVGTHLLTCTHQLSTQRGPGCGSPRMAAGECGDSQRRDNKALSGSSSLSAVSSWPVGLFPTRAVAAFPRWPLVARSSWTHHLRLWGSQLEGVGIWPRVCAGFLGCSEMEPRCVSLVRG